MRRTLWVTMIVVIAISLTSSLVLAGMRVNSITFSTEDTSTLSTTSSTTQLSGSNLETNSTDTSSCNGGPCIGLQLNATGVFTGVGEADGVVELLASGSATVMCTNKGKQFVPGQNFDVVMFGDQPLSPVTRNGTSDFDVTTDMPSTYPGSQMGCPNDNWTATILSIQFTSATIKVTQDGIVTLEQTYYF